MVFDRDYKDHNPPMQIITKLYRKLYNMFDTDLENGVKKENFINISEIARAAGREIWVKNYKRE